MVSSDVNKEKREKWNNVTATHFHLYHPCAVVKGILKGIAHTHAVFSAVACVGFQLALTCIYLQTSQTRKTTPKNVNSLTLPARPKTVFSCAKNLISAMLFVLRSSLGRANA